MNLAQKLPLGLALACCMMMSSCSQEDVQVAGPETISSTSNLKVASLPAIPTTNGPSGNNKFASGWKKLVMSSPDDLQLYVAGTSNKNGLWGNAFFPWSKPLPNNFAITNFVTFTRQKNVLANYGTYSAVQTKITGLIPGKKYAVTFNVASTIRTISGEPTQYSPGVVVDILGTLSPSPLGPGTTVVDLTNKEAEWVTKTITFQAVSSETLVNIQPYADSNYFNSHNKFLHYCHVFVDQNAITEVQ
jgi:hypothetical protein